MSELCVNKHSLGWENLLPPLEMQFQDSDPHLIRIVTGNRVFQQAAVQASSVLLCKPAVEKASPEASSRGGCEAVRLVLLLADPECLTPETRHLILIEMPPTSPAPRPFPPKRDALWARDGVATRPAHTFGMKKEWFLPSSGL